MAFAPDYPAARVVASPNHGERLRPISALILHYTGMPTSESALALLRSPAAEVSAHYFVEENGEVLQLVPEDRRAWHAGKSFWAGETDLNSASIGIEIVHPGHDDPRPFPARQIASVIALSRDICRRHAIAPQRVLAHSDIAVSRKIDPGEFFPWDVLAREGVGHYVAPAPILGDEGLGPGDWARRSAGFKTSSPATATLLRRAAISTMIRPRSWPRFNAISGRKKLTGARTSRRSRRLKICLE